MTEPTTKPGIFYRTVDPKTPKIDRDWSLKERLAFGNQPALSVAELTKIFPERALNSLGDFKPTDEVFRKLATGYGKVSEPWLRLGRTIGVWDFSVDQAAFIAVAVFLDSLNVRVKLHLSVEDTTRGNSIEYFCLGDPDYQGLIRYYNDRLAITPNLFERVLRKRIDVFKLYCDYLPDVLEIPGESDIPTLLYLAEKEASENAEKVEVNELDTVVNHQLSDLSEDGESDGEGDDDDDTAEGEISGIFTYSASDESGVEIGEVYNSGEHTDDEVAAVAEEVLPVPEKPKRGRPKGGKKSAEAEADSLPGESPSEAESDGLGVDLDDFQSAIESHAIQDMAQVETVADDEHSGEEPYHDTSQEEANQAEDEQAARMAEVYTDPSFANLQPPGEVPEFGY